MERAVRMGVSNASFRIGGITVAGCLMPSIGAVLGTDAIQFPDEPASAYEEIRMVFTPRDRGGTDLLGSAGPQR